MKEYGIRKSEISNIIQLPLYTAYFITLSVARLQQRKEEEEEGEGEGQEEEEHDDDDDDDQRIVEEFNPICQFGFISNLTK